jgi:hypothetical protein
MRSICYCARTVTVSFRSSNHALALVLSWLWCVPGDGRPSNHVLCICLEVAESQEKLPSRVGETRQVVV